SSVVQRIITRARMLRKSPFRIHLMVFTGILYVLTFRALTVTVIFFDVIVWDYAELRTAKNSHTFITFTISNFVLRTIFETVFFVLFSMRYISPLHMLHTIFQVLPVFSFHRILRAKDVYFPVK
ncbi:hypothetical protein L9F63_016337, partial [Diploptera punctata]